MANFMTLDSYAIGLIQASDTQKERLEEFTEQVASGKFHRPVANNQTIPARCVDGRSTNGTPPLAPNAAGGSETLFVADDLTVKGLATPDDTTRSAYKNTLHWLKVHTFEVGGHTDTGAQGDASGCGANDKLGMIYSYIANHGDVLRAVAGDLGVSVLAETHDRILKNARERSQFSKGRELLDELKESARPEFIDVLEGDHKEVVAVINTKDGTTLDRSALQKEFGSDYQAFNVDVWSFKKAAEAISVEPLEPHEIEQKVAAMVYYNLATTFVLAGPAMRVVVLQ